MSANSYRKATYMVINTYSTRTTMNASENVGSYIDCFKLYKDSSLTLWYSTTKHFVNVLIHIF